MDISPWIENSDRQPTRADLPVELYFGIATERPKFHGPTVVEYLTDEQARRRHFSETMSRFRSLQWPTMTATPTGVRIGL